MTEGKPGRPRGKKSDPNYIQITSYLPKKIHRAVKIRCAELDTDRSAVIEALLIEWLERSKPKPRARRDRNRTD